MYEEVTQRSGPDAYGSCFCFPALFLSAYIHDQMRHFLRGVDREREDFWSLFSDSYAGYAGTTPNWTATCL